MEKGPFVALLLAWLTSPPLAAAQQEPAAQPKPAASAIAATPPAASAAPARATASTASTAVGRVAEQLARALPEGLPRPALVVAAPLVSDVAAPRGAVLARTLAGLVAGARGLPVHGEALPFEAARTAARSHRALIHVRTSIEAGKLRATVDVVPTPANRWARLRDPTPAPIAHAFAESRIDAEVRAHLVPVPLTALAPIRGRAFESGVVAALCEDLDGDGASEIVTVSRTRVVLLRLRAGKVVPVHARAWADLAPVAPTPLREPIAFAVAVAARPSSDDPDGARRDVVVSITDRAGSVRLDARLEVIDHHPRLAVPDGDGVACADVIDLTVSGALAACAPGGPPAGAPSVGGRYDGFASMRLVRPDGSTMRVTAGREDGVLELRDAQGRVARISGAGAQIALGDLDQDGAVEVLSALDVSDPVGDAVVVRTWTGAGAPREVFRMPAGAGVHAIATCPPEGGGRQPFVVATADEIVVVR